MNNRKVLIVILLLIAIMAARFSGKMEEHNDNVPTFRQLETERDSLKTLCDSLLIQQTIKVKLK